jgi:starvation-inducible DNA-binding protein
MTGSLKIASFKEAQGNETAEKMVQSTVNDFTQMIEVLKQGMELAESVNDDITGDMFIAIHPALEKHVWMLNSFLGK